MRCKCFNYNNGEEKIAAPYGNDFQIHVSHTYVAPMGPQDATFGDIDDLRAFFVQPSHKIEMECAVVGSGDLMVYVPASMVDLAIYGLELTGTYNGHAWRWKGSSFIHIVDETKDNSLVGGESFGPDTYYIGDDLDAEIEDDSLILISNGHAALVKGAAVIKSSLRTDVNLDRSETLNITEYGS